MDSVDSAKKFGIIFIILLILIPLIIALARLNAIQNLQLKLKLATQEKPKVTVINKQISDILQEEHSNLYFVDLEYDPKTAKVTKKGSGHSHGDMDPLLSKPSSDSGTFNYRVETIYTENEAPLSGWVSFYKTVISTEDGKYIFRTSVPYISGSTLNIYSINNQKLWEEKIN